MTCSEVIKIIIYGEKKNKRGFKSMGVLKNKKIEAGVNEKCMCLWG
jgi:hypothetical protein